MIFGAFGALSTGCIAIKNVEMQDYGLLNTLDHS